MSPWLLISAWYCLASVVSFGTYWQDKVRARQGKWRTRERTLLVIDLFGGWPGGYAAQRVVRHKTLDRKFQIWFWLIVVTHVMLWALVAWALNK